MKKAVSFLLTLILIAGFVPVLVAGAADAACPTVYINGGRKPLYTADGRQFAPVTPPDGYVGDAVSDCLPDLGKALLTGSAADIDAYRQKLVSWVAPLYDDMRMDDNGDPPAPIYVGYGSSGSYYIPPETVTDKISNGQYALYAYEYFYDWRADPLDVADELNRFIEAIIAATGRDRVNLLGRCEGGCPLMAYLARYGHAHVNRIMFYNTASNGYLLPSQLFSGKIDISMAQVKAWLDNNVHFSMDSLDLSKDLMDLLQGMLSVSAAVPQLDLMGSALDAAYNRVLREVLPDVILASYGTMPAVWAMIDAADFDDAVQYVFAGKEAQYAGLIARIRAYHETVQLQSEALLKSAEADGVQIGVMAKYGYPAIPLTKESSELSDGEALTKYLSFGATCAPHAGRLSDDYIAGRDPAMISADKMIDASTCLFPETTWFFGAVDHQTYPWEMDDLAQRFFIADQDTDVHTLAAYPQFLVRDAGGAMVPLTEDNADTAVVGKDDTEQENGPSYREGQKKGDPEGGPLRKGGNTDSGNSADDGSAVRK